MEPLFINQYTRDEAVTKEYHRSYYFTPIFWVIYVLFGICFIYSIVYICMGYPAYDSLILMLITVIFIFFLRRYRISTAIKRDKEQFGQSPHMVCEVSETGIRIGTNDYFSQEVPFSEIRHARETKHLILLVSRARLLYILHKDGFVKGSLPEFNRFLQDKKIRFQ